MVEEKKKDYEKSNYNLNRIMTICTIIVTGTSLLSVYVILAPIQESIKSVSTDTTKLRSNIDNLTNIIHKQQQDISKFTESIKVLVNRTR